MFWMNYLAYAAMILALIILYRAVRVSFYDINKFRRNKKSAKAAKKSKGVPLISVVLVAEDNEETATDCLNSIFASSIRKIEVVVIDSKSSDHTTKIIRDYIKHNSGKSVRLVAKRTKSKRFYVTKNFAKKYLNGELACVITADSIMAKHTLKQARSYFLSNEDTDLLLFNSTSVFQPRIPELANSIKSLMQSRMHKISKVKYLPKVNYIIKREAITTKYIKNAVYESSAMILENSNGKSHKHLMVLLDEIRPNLINIIFALTIASLMLCAFLEGNTTFFIIGWIAATADYIFLIFGDGNINTYQKFRLLGYSPIMYIFTLLIALYWTIVLLLIIFKPLKKLKNIKLLQTGNKLKPSNKPA